MSASPQSQPIGASNAAAAPVAASLRCFAVRGDDVDLINPALFEDAESLGELIAAVNASDLSEGRIICRIDLDGIPINDQDPSWAETKLSSAGEIHLHLLDRDRLLESALSEAAEVAAQTRTRFMDSAWGLRLEEASAWNTLADAADSLHELIRFVHSAGAVVGDHEGALTAIKIFEGELLKAVRSVHNMQQKKDSLGIADEIESTLLPALETWDACYPEIQNAF